MFASWNSLTLLFLLLLCAPAPATTAKSENTFIIRVDPSVTTKELQVRYFLTGDFGGFGGFQIGPQDDHVVLIHTEVEGKPAKSLKAALYAPGCQIQMISAVNLSVGDAEGDFHCLPVGTTKLQGKFSRRTTTPDRTIEVQVQYLGYWGHRFFGIADGAVLSFNIAESPVEPDGSFQLLLPNLAGNGGLPLQTEDASFSLLVRDADSGNILAELKPPAALSRDGELKIIPNYPQTTEFDVDWRLASPHN